MSSFVRQDVAPFILCVNSDHKSLLTELPEHQTAFFNISSTAYNQFLDNTCDLVPMHPSVSRVRCGTVRFGL